MSSRSAEASSSEGRVKILHVITDLALAGAETKLYKLLKASSRDRFLPAVVSLRSDGELVKRIQQLEIPVYELGVRGSAAGPVSLWRLLAAARRFDPDLIHGWMCHGNLAAQVAAVFAARKARVVWSIHQSLYGFEYEKRATAAIIRICAHLSKLPARIIYTSNTAAEQHEAIGYDANQRVVIHYGFDTNVFAPSADARREIRDELNVPADTLLIGLVARYHPAKDHATFLRAAALLLKTHPPIHFVLCGKQVDGDNEQLRRLIRNLGFAGQVHLLGERPDIPRVMAALDIAASSSCTEGFPNVVGEAMAAGVPCVVTSVSDVASIVGETGQVVAPKDPFALAGAFEKLVAIGAESRQALGAAARARVCNNFSLGSSVGKYEAVYERVLAEAGAECETEPAPSSHAVCPRPEADLKLP